MNPRISRDVSESTLDAYVAGWAVAGLFFIHNLWCLVGPAAIIVAALACALALWKRTRGANQPPRRFWWCCWVALCFLDVGLTVSEAYACETAATLISPFNP
jgi:hypothetical protein